MVDFCNSLFYGTYPLLKKTNKQTTHQFLCCIENVGKKETFHDITCFNPISNP